jgi:hypothetical protein
MDFEDFEEVEMTDKYLAWCEDLGETIEDAKKLDGPWPEDVAAEYVKKAEYESADGPFDGSEGIVVSVCHSEDMETVCRYEVYVEISVEYRAKVI